MPSDGCEPVTMKPWSKATVNVLKARACRHGEKPVAGCCAQKDREDRRDQPERRNRQHLDQWDRSIRRCKFEQCVRQEIGQRICRLSSQVGRNVGVIIKDQEIRIGILPFGSQMVDKTCRKCRQCQRPKWYAVVLSSFS